MYFGHEVAGARFVFEGGRIVEATARSGEEFLIETLDTDEGARRLGELGIGCNPGIQRFMKNVAFDEKIDGTVHLAVGNSYSFTGGTNKSAIHWDIVKDLRTDGRATPTAARAGERPLDRCLTPFLESDTCSGRGGDLAGEPRVADDQVAVRRERAPAALAVQVGEDERRHALAVHALGRRCRERLLDQRLDVVEALVRRAAEQQAAAAELPVRAPRSGAASAAVSTRAETGGPPCAA